MLRFRHYAWLLGLPLIANPLIAQQSQIDYGALYRAISPSVVEIQTEFGHGSGFLVAEGGLFLTNQHVIRGAEYITVRFGQGRRHPGVLVAQDVDHDLALVRIHPDFVVGLKPLNLMTSPDLIAEGAIITAFGYPLNFTKVMTTGLVSRVETAYIASDVNINPGNSGGPVVRSDGTVIGVATFSYAAAAGPGLSGIVPISDALPLIQQASGKGERANLNAQPVASTAMPAKQTLPDIPSLPVPLRMIQECAKKDIKAITIKNPRDCLTTIYTPFVLASGSSRLERDLDRRRGGRGVAGSMAEPAREYEIHEYLPVVSILIEPLLRETDASSGNRFIGALFGVSTDPTEFRYKVEFKDMELLRGGKVVEPVRRVKKVVGGLESAVADTFDVAYAGAYQYHPASFETSAKLRIRVKRSTDGDKWIEFDIPEKAQKAIYESFKPYLELLSVAKAP